MSGEEPVRSRTFTRGGRQNRGGRGTSRGGGPQQHRWSGEETGANEPPAAPPGLDLSAREFVPRGGARPRPQGRVRDRPAGGGAGGGRARGRGRGAGYHRSNRALPSNGTFSDPAVAFNGPDQGLLPSPSAFPNGSFAGGYRGNDVPFSDYQAYFGDVRQYGDNYMNREGQGGNNKQFRNNRPARGSRGRGQKQLNGGGGQQNMYGRDQNGDRQLRYDPEQPEGYDDQRGRNDAHLTNHAGSAYHRNSDAFNYNDPVSLSQGSPEHQPHDSVFRGSNHSNGSRGSRQDNYERYYGQQYDQQYDGDGRRSGRQRQQWAGYKAEPSRRQRGGGRGGQSKPQHEQTKPSAADLSAEAELGQRERMQEQLTHGRYECLVCVDAVKQTDPVWSCLGCYHVFHMGCVRRWAKSSRQESGGWRCPACQKVSSAPPTTYKCFCGKLRDPAWNRRDTPHSCGEVCRRSRTTPGCTHRCTLLCHPGPCPPCTASVKRSCPCGKKTVDIKCELAATLTCQETCGRTLACGSHTCTLTCHLGDCHPCEVKIDRVCFCGKEQKQEPCAPEASREAFCCGAVCGRQLSCKLHSCEKFCHGGECGDCPLSPKTVTRCPCGAKPLSELSAGPRSLCTDPVPTCGGVCGRRLPCGPPGAAHTCRAACHAGPCPPCGRQTAVRCRCGFMDCELPCAELTTRADDARCQKRCTKKRSCGRHKCGQECCILAEHVCLNTCGRKLTCGVHTCEEPCHVGQCRPCLLASFEELYCECGTSVLFPPVPCGTPPPPCSQPCSRHHPCGHPVLHSCHSQAECPPCVHLMKKMCYGRHEERSSVPCHQTAVSCGRPCGVALACGRHKCKEPCHAGTCPEQAGCKQSCATPRPDCGHPCSAPCHDGPCPSTPCRTKVRVSCECGHRNRTLACSDTGAYRVLNTSLIAHKLSAIQTGGASVDVSDLMTAGRNGRNKALQCNAECAVLERNRRLAEALQIRNPELGSGTGPPAYPPSMLDVARKAKGLAEDVHRQLTELVQLAQQSRQKSRSVAFAPMNRERRQFIHEYCEHFGCESESYDEEPKRNVVATAYRDRCWLPTVSVLQVVEREAGPRKVAPAQLSSKRDTASSKGTKLEPAKSAKDEPAIDYFDFTG